MIDFILQLTSLFLVAAGLLFIIIQLLVRFDRMFFFLGAALIIFGLVPAIDIWIIPRESVADQILFWTRVQHVLTVMLFPVILWYLNNFLKSDIRYLQLAVTVLAVAFSPMFFSGAAISFANGRVCYGPWYFFIVLPCASIAGGTIVVIILKKLKETRDNERRILFYHFIGFTLLCAFGLLDLLVKSMSHVVTIPFPSFFILGVFAFGLMIFLIFTERFMILISERQAAYDKLREALRDMEEASTLRQIGESTAVINHEIKNYLVSIRGSAELIKLTENLTEDGVGLIKVIMKSIDDMQNFNQDVLQLSRARLVKEKELLAIVPLLRQTIGSYFPEQRKSILIDTPSEGYTVHGDWNKLEHVFVNLIKNSFEAEATALSVQFRSTGNVLLITLFDNGTGCTPEQQANLFKAFYTTKKGRRGTGLGLSISRAVIESHGGHITAYPLNTLGEGIHGLKFNISLPHGPETAQEPRKERTRVVALREGMSDLAALLTICGNVQVFPRVVQSADDLEKGEDLGGVAILAAEQAYPRKRQRNAAARKDFMVSVKNGIIYTRSPVENSSLELFSEDLVVYKLFAN